MSLEIEERSSFAHGDHSVGCAEGHVADALRFVESFACRPVLSASETDDVVRAGGLRAHVYFCRACGTFAVSAYSPADSLSVFEAIAAARRLFSTSNESCDAQMRCVSVQDVMCL